MQQLINQLQDEQLLDLFILIEDHQGQLAINYLLKNTHFSRSEAIAIVHFLTQQQELNFKTYQQSPPPPNSNNYKKLHIPSQQGFYDPTDSHFDFSQIEIFNQSHPASSDQQQTNFRSRYEKRRAYFWVSLTIFSLFFCVIASIVIHRLNL